MLAINLSVWYVSPLLKFPPKEVMYRSDTNSQGSGRIWTQAIYCQSYVLDKYVLEHFPSVVNAAYWNGVGTEVSLLSVCLLIPLKFSI